MSIDVEALETAYVKVIDRTPWVEVVFSADGGLEVQRRMFLERIAAEYARLAAEDEGRLRKALDEALRPYLVLLRSPDDQNDNIIRGVASRVRAALAATPEPWTDPKG